jgi:hypothetical protein
MIHAVPQSGDWQIPFAVTSAHERYELLEASAAAVKSYLQIPR